MLLDPYTIDDIETLLLAEEEIFEKHKKIKINLIYENTSTIQNLNTRGKPRSQNYKGGYGNNRRRINNKYGFQSNKEDINFVEKGFITKLKFKTTMLALW